jgi:hypothetical protein
MNKKAQGRSRLTPYFAMVLISLCAVSQGLHAQNIYKCGNSYSQTPCTGASTLNLDDARTSAQKQQTDAATRSDTKLAQSLEKNRIAQEKVTSTRPPAASQAGASAVPRNPVNVVSKITPKRVKSKKYKPKAFIAQVPGSEKKPVKKTPAKEKTAAPA